MPVETMVTHRLGLKEATKAFQWVASPVEHDCIKVIVEPHNGER